MARTPSEPNGWLAERLGKLGWSMRTFAGMLGENLEQVSRWNGTSKEGKFYEVPDPVMRWLDEVERFFRMHPAPKKAVYAAARREEAGKLPPPFVRRLIDVMQPGETASAEDLAKRLDAETWRVWERLAYAAADGRTGPLRRIGDEAVYRAVSDEVPPGASVDFPPRTRPALAAITAQIMEVLKPGEEKDLKEVGYLMGQKPSKVRTLLAKAAAADRLGPLVVVGEDRVRRLPDDGKDDDDRVEGHDEPQTAPVERVVPPPPPAPTPPPPQAEKPAMTPERFNEIFVALNLSRRDLARRLSIEASDGKVVSRWRQGSQPVPVWVAAWLEELWAVRGEPLALKEVWNRPPSQSGPGATEAVDPPMRSAEFKEVLGLLGLSGRSLQRKVSWVGPPEMLAWTQDAEPVEPTLARWLRALVRASGDEEETQRLLHRQPPPPALNAERWNAGSKKRHPEQRSDESERPRTPNPALSEDMQTALLALGQEWASRDSIAASTEDLEALRKAGLVERGSRPRPGEPSRFDDLYRLSDAGKREKGVIHAEQKAEAAADPSEIPGVSRSTYQRVHKPVLEWVTNGEILPKDDPAHEDISASLRETYVDGASTSAWIQAAERWLEHLGYTDEPEPDPLEEILPPDHPVRSVRPHRPGQRFVDLTRKGE